MVQLINLATEANQSFSMILDSHRYEMTIRSSFSGILADLAVDGMVVMAGMRILPKEPIAPYHYMTSGNFVLLTEQDQLPDFREFGITQFLFYVDKETLTKIQTTGLESLNVH